MLGLIAAFLGFGQSRTQARMAAEMQRNQARAFNQSVRTHDHIGQTNQAQREAAKYICLPR